MLEAVTAPSDTFDTVSAGELLIVSAWKEMDVEGATMLGRLSFQERMKEGKRRGYSPLADAGNDCLGTHFSPDRFDQAGQSGFEPSLGTSL